MCGPGTGLSPGCRFHTAGPGLFSLPPDVGAASHGVCASATAIHCGCSRCSPWEQDTAGAPAHRSAAGLSRRCGTSVWVRCPRRLHGVGWCSSASGHRLHGSLSYVPGVMFPGLSGDSTALGGDSTALGDVPRLGGGADDRTADDDLHPPTSYIGG